MLSMLSMMSAIFSALSFAFFEFDATSCAAEDSALRWRALSIMSIFRGVPWSDVLLFLVSMRSLLMMEGIANPNLSFALSRKLLEFTCCKLWRMEASVLDRRICFTSGCCDRSISGGASSMESSSCESF